MERYVSGKKTKRMDAIWGRECERCLLFEPAEDLMTRTSGCTRSSFEFYRNFIDRRDNFSPLSFFHSFACEISPFSLFFEGVVIASPLPASPPLPLYRRKEKRDAAIAGRKGTATTVDQLRRNVYFSYIINARSTRANK